MRILMIGPSIKMQGGISTVVRNYLEFLQDKDVNITYVSTINSEKNRILKLLDAFRGYCLILFNLLIKNIDIVHIHMASRGSFYRKSFVVMMSNFFNKKVVIHLHGAEFEQFYHQESNAKQKKRIKKILDTSNHVIALGTKWRETVEEITKTPVSVLHNSVLCNKVNNYNKDAKNIVFFGRVDERKGAFDIIKVAGTLSKCIPEYKIYLCGDGDLENIRQIIEKENLNQYIQLTGWISGDEKKGLLRNSIINLLPSYNEGLPMSLLEAMAEGIPTITTNVGAIPDVIINGENGIMIKPGDLKGLENVIINLIKNEDYRCKLSEEAHKTVREKFNIENNILELMDIYLKLV